MTETSPLVTVTPENIAKIGSCGVLLPNTEGKITDLDNGEALGPNKRGELCVKGPQVRLYIYTHTHIYIYPYSGALYKIFHSEWLYVQLPLRMALCTKKI